MQATLSSETTRTITPEQSEVIDNLIISRESETHVEIEHSNQGKKYGYDITSFHRPELFKRFLSEIGLDPDNDYIRVDRTDKSGSMEGEDYYYYCWVNETILLVTGRNPITGEHSRPKHIDPNPGHASYVGLQAPVHEASAIHSKILREAKVKDWTEDRLFF